MDVRLSAEQRAFRAAAAQLVDRLGVKAVGDLDDSARAQRLEAAVASAGWRELRAAGDDGQPLASTVEVALVAEELGRGVADVAFTGPTLAAELRRLAGAPAAGDPETVLLTRDLADLADLDDQADADRSALAVDCSAAGSGLLLDRRTRHLLAIELQSPDGPAPAPVDLTRDLRPVHPGSAGAVLGALAPAAFTRWTAFGLAVACADLVGVMRGTLELARSYACTREQYGVPIGSFQAVQHLLADAHVAVEGSRSTALHAAWAVDNLTPADALAAAAGAKAYCARAALSVCETSIQVHGGIGNTWECLAHVYLRRALVSADLLGNIGPSLQRILNHRLGAA